MKTNHSNMKISTIIFVFILIINNVSARLQWNQNWALGCDFYENNLKNLPMRGEECGPTCDRTPRCTHFTWTTWNGGTCWMKQGRVNKDDAFETSDGSMVCGLSWSTYQNNNGYLK